MNTKDIADMMDFSQKVVLNAFKITNWFFQKKIDVKKKTNSTPVTIADLASQIYIIYQIKNTFPDHGIVAEEDNSNLNNDDVPLIKECFDFLFHGTEIFDAPDSLDFSNLINYRGNSENNLFWSIDPIDGTKGFIAGNSYAIGLCFFKNFIPFLTSIGVPKYSGNELTIFTAIRDQGAHKVNYNNNILQNPIKIHVSETDSFAEVKLTRSLNNPVGWESEFLKGIGISSEIQVDGMGKACLVADGRADIYFRPYDKNKQFIWDVGPVDLLIRESGGKVLNFNGDPLTYSQFHVFTETFGYFASNSKLANKFLVELEDPKTKKLMINKIKK